MGLVEWWRGSWDWSFKCLFFTSLMSTHLLLFDRDESGRRNRQMQVVLIVEFLAILLIYSCACWQLCSSCFWSWSVASVNAGWRDTPECSGRIRYQEHVFYTASFCVLCTFLALLCSGRICQRSARREPKATGPTEGGELLFVPFLGESCLYNFCDSFFFYLFFEE